MDQAKYELIKKVRKMKDALRAKRRYGGAGYLEKKLAASRMYFAQKRKGEDRRFAARKQARFERGQWRLDKKAVKFSARALRWNKRWERRTARWEARTAR